MIDNDLIPNSNFSSLNLTKTNRQYRNVAYIFIILLGLFILGAIVLPWQQTVRGYGKVTAFTPLERKQTVQSPIYGKVTKWFVTEGSKVKKGDKLVEISDIDENYLDRLINEKKSILLSIKAYESKVIAIKDRITDLTLSKINAEQIADLIIENKEAKLLASRREIDYNEANFYTADLNYSRTKKMYNNKLSSTRKLELTELKYKQAKAKLEKSRAYLIANEKDYKSAISKKKKTVNDTNSYINKEKSELGSAVSLLEKSKQNIQKIDSKIARQNSRFIKSQVDGTVFRIHKPLESEYVKLGAKLATIIPDTKQRAIELWVDGNDIPLITSGDMVRLQFEGWPALQFSGWPSVAVGTFAGRVSFVDQTISKDDKFRVVVTPDEKEQEWPADKYLRQGTRAYGWVLLREVKIWFELWRQFNGFPPTIDSKNNKKIGPVKLKKKK